jgi:polysaccharide export outer membrane protein
MNIQRFLLLFVVIACCMVGVAQTQQQKQNRGPYLVGPGDVVEVKVFGQPDLNVSAEVDGDGNLSSLPYIDPVPATCRSEKQLQKDITVAYGRLIKEPQISVRVVARNSRPPASVSGAVRKEGTVPMVKKQRLHEVIAAAGGFTEKASGTIQILHTEPVLCPAPGEDVEALPINGTEIPFQVVNISDLKKGVSNPTIRPGDLILVTEAEPIYITGSVVAPGGIMLRDQLTLSRALAMVGGPRAEAKLSEIRIYRQKAGSTGLDIIKVNFSAIKKNEQPDVFLKPYDVIDVSESGIFSGDGWWRLLVGSLAGGLRNTLAHPIPY